MSFIVNHDGVVSESDFGPDTAKNAAAMTGDNPTADWQPADPQSKPALHTPM